MSGFGVLLTVIRAEHRGKSPCLGLEFFLPLSEQSTEVNLLASGLEVLTTVPLLEQSTEVNLHVWVWGSYSRYQSGEQQ